MWISPISLSLRDLQCNTQNPVRDEHNVSVPRRTQHSIRINWTAEAPLEDKPDSFEAQILSCGCCYKLECPSWDTWDTSLELISMSRRRGYVLQLNDNAQNKWRERPKKKEQIYPNDPSIRCVGHGTRFPETSATHCRVTSSPGYTANIHPAPMSSVLSTCNSIGAFVRVDSGVS